MRQINENESRDLIEQEKEKLREVINAGGKVIDTIIYENDKITTIRKIEPVNEKSTCSKIITKKDEISISCF